MNAVRDTQGQIVESRSMVVDITERKQAEEEIRRGKILLESSIESPKDMIILSLDREYRYLYFNKTHAESMSHVFGTRPKIGDCIFDHMKGKDDIEKVKEHYDRVFAGEGHIAIEEYGESQLRYYYEIRYNPVYDEKDEIIAVTSFAQNITERIQAEEALRESEEKYRQLFTTVTDAIMLFDAETTEFIDVNDATLSLYGYSREEFLRLRHPDITAEPEASMESYKKAINGTLARIPIRYHRKKDGTKFPVEISTGVLNLGDRQVLCGVVRDISERKRAEEEKVRLEAKLQRTQKMESMGLRPLRAVVRSPYPLRIGILMGL